MEKKDTYTTLLMQLSSLLEDEYDTIANLSNASALLFDILPQLNWAGFYLYKENQLILGPFQGKPACIRIPMGKGVCGTSAEQKKSLCVKDVHQFPGHIACDARSNSEIVIPIIKKDTLFGVLDIDSYVFDRFDDVDLQYLEQFVELLSLHI